MDNIEMLVFAKLYKQCKYNILIKKCKKILNQKSFGFTLAEMMVVMLILSIIMAAMAPVMTSRNKLDQSSPWSWAENGSDAYYGLGDAQVAMIGQDKVNSSDDGARLILNTPSGRNHILFKTGDTVNGLLNMSNYNVFLGKLGSGLSIGTRSTGLGYEIGPSGQFSTALGYKATSSGIYSLAVGRMTTAQGMSSVAVGNVNTITKNFGIAYGSSNTVSAQNAIAIGKSNVVSGTDSIVLGKSNTISTANSIGIGSGVTSAENSIAIGKNAHANGKNSIAISNGSAVETSGEYSISIGSNSSNPTGAYSIAIGESSFAPVDSSVAIGPSSNAESHFSVLVGNNTSSTEDYSIAIGDSASNVGGSNNSGGIGAIAIGQASKTSGFMGVAIGRNSIASGIASIAFGSSDGIYSKTESLAENSIAIGMNAKAKRVNNIAIGANACKYVTGANKICIGANSGPGAGNSWAMDDRERIFIGSQSAYNGAPAVLEVHNNPYKTVYAHDGNVFKAKDSTVVINGNLIVKGTLTSWVVDRYGNYVSGYRTLERHREDEDNASLRYSIENGYGFNEYFSYGTGYTKTSDRRLKYVGKESTSGLDKIRQLKVFNYTFKQDKAKTPHVGVIAQDLQKVFPNAVSKAKDGFLKIRLEDMFYAMINAIKELDAKYQAQEKRINELEKRIEKLEAQVK